jgi:hypothetical protein
MADDSPRVCLPKGIGAPVGRDHGMWSLRLLIDQMDDRHKSID